MAGGRSLNLPPALRPGGRASLDRMLPGVVLIGLIVAISAAQPSFATYTSLRVVGEDATVILLLAAGQSVVIMLGCIDLSVAALASLCAVALAKLVPELGVGGLVLVLLGATLVGAVQGYVHAKAQVPSFVVTLGGLAIFSGVALTVSGESSVPLRENYEVVGWATDRIGGYTGFPVSILFTAAVVRLLAAAMRFLPFGRYARAIGLAEPAALMSGVRTTRVRVAAFALSSLFGALAAVLLVSDLSSGGPTQADNLLLPSIAAVVVGGSAITGGVGSVGRAVIGALIIAVLRVGMSVAGVPPSAEQLVYGAVVIAAVALTLDRSKLRIVK